MENKTINQKEHTQARYLRLFELVKHRNNICTWLYPTSASQQEINKGSFRTIDSKCVSLCLSFDQADVLKADLDKAINADFGDLKPRKSFKTQTTDTR